jgi:hypothetical protein
MAHGIWTTRIDRRFEKKMKQPRRYHQWSNAVLNLKFDDDCNPIMPGYTNSDKESEGRNKAACIAIIRHYLKEGCCFCGSKKKLTFHHREKKQFTIGQNLYRRDPKTLDSECKKCVVLCESCHRTLHKQERELGLAS